MSYILSSSQTISADLKLPASKSISNRALILNALSYSDTPIVNLSDCDDTQVMIEAFNSNDNQFDIHGAGTAMRFLTAFLSKVVGEWIITGSERMRQRPIKLLVEALRSLGARIEYTKNEGYPPLRIFGSSLTGGKLSLDGGVSSQYISALLMIAPCMEQGLELTLTGDVISKPYIRMTLGMMKEFGVDAIWRNNVIVVKPQTYTPCRFEVESDWSAASYWYEIASLSTHFNRIALQGLRQKSDQGDAVIADLFTQLGIGTDYNATGCSLKQNGNQCKKMIADLVDYPDMAQTLVVTCALKGIPFRFTGLQSLKIKETDRIDALKTELTKLGYLIADKNNSILEWNGERCEPQPLPTIDTYDDHRMAMAFAPAALLFPEIRINHPEVVNKSYPTFWNDLALAGFNIKEIKE